MKKSRLIVRGPGPGLYFSIYYIDALYQARGDVGGARGIVQIRALQIQCIVEAGGQWGAAARHQRLSLRPNSGGSNYEESRWLVCSIGIRIHSCSAGLGEDFSVMALGLLLIGLQSLNSGNGYV